MLTGQYSSVEWVKKMKMVKEHVEPDTVDEKIAEVRIAKFNKRKGPREGDFVIWNGEYHRFSSDNGMSIQHSEGGSFYITESGKVSFSGGLEPGIMKHKMEEMAELRPGMFWFFHHNVWKGDNAVYVETDCRVYKVIGGE